MPARARADATVLESVGVVGNGRLGTALARALRAAGTRVVGPLGRSAERNAPLDAIVLCVPDAQIARAAAAYAGMAPFIGHTSGATPLTALDASAEGLFGLHPLQTFVGGDTPERFDGVACAIAGSTTEALGTARRLAGMLGMQAFEISDANRAAYHAAACIASNFLMTLEDAAEQIARGAGIDATTAHDMLVPLVEASVENWAAHGPRSALTGPVARGDQGTVARQRVAVGQVAPELLALFDVLVERTQALAGRPEAAE